MELALAPAAIRGAHDHFVRLFNRASDELMVLGFLAFCIWCINQAEGFKHLSESLDGRPDESSLLHLAENVLMFLFLAMLLNFAVAAYMIHRMMQWQLLFAAWEHGLDPPTTRPP